MKTLYEINWHYKDDAQTKFSHCTVTPITVICEGTLPGCGVVAITGKDSDGRTFQGSPRDYFETEAQAWAQAKQYLRDTMKKNDEVVAAINAESDRLFSFLVTLPPPEA